MLFDTSPSNLSITFASGIFANEVTVVVLGFIKPSAASSRVGLSQLQQKPILPDVMYNRSADVHQPKNKLNASQLAVWNVQNKPKLSNIPLEYYLVWS
jgi:hypothetical protein